MSAGKQPSRRQLPRRRSNSIPETNAGSSAAAAPADTKPSRTSRREQQQQDVAAEAVADAPKGSKRLKAVYGTSSDGTTDTADRDTTTPVTRAAAAGPTSAAVSRRGSPAAAATLATPATQQQQQVAAASGSNSASTAVTALSSGGMSAFEAERAARIAANMARLAALKLPDMAADLVASAPPKHKAAPTQRGVGTKRRRSEEEQQPLRRSGRHRGEAPDPTTAGGIDYEGRDGKIVLAAALQHIPMHAATAAISKEAAAAAAAAAAAVLTAPVPFRSSNGDDESDAAFLALLKTQATAAAVNNSSSNSDSITTAAAVTGHDLTKLSLSAVDVAKMTRDGVSCMAFHPGTDKLIIAAADKQGKVGLWDIDHQLQQQQEGADASSSSYDGVLMFEPHRDYVSSMKWLNRGSTLMTGSYDGTLRFLDVEKGVWEVVGGLPAGVSAAGWSAGESTPDGSVVYLATSEGDLTVHDTRTDGSSSSTWDVSNRKVNTLHLHSNMQHLASSSSDGAVAVWDVRQLSTAGHSSGSSSSKPRHAKPVCKVSHEKSSQGAYWCPDGSCRLLSISFDDTLQVWSDPAGKGQLHQELRISHNNNTGRWVVAFRPAWSPAGDAVIVGDLKRGVALFDSSNGKQLGLLQAEALTAIPSRMALHPSRDVKVLAAATSSGRVHIWR